MAVDQETNGPVVPLEPPRGLIQARVDNKGRLKLSASFQKYFDSIGVKQFYVTTRDERLVYIAPLELWKKFEAVLDNPETEELAQAYERVRFVVDKYGGDATMDGEGRLLLSQELRQKLSLLDAPVWLQFRKGVILAYNETEYKARERELESSREVLAKANSTFAVKGF